MVLVSKCIFLVTRNSINMLQWDYMWCERLNSRWRPKWRSKLKFSHIFVTSRGSLMILVSKCMFAGSMNPMDHSKLIYLCCNRYNSKWRTKWQPQNEIPCIFKTNRAIMTSKCRFLGSRNPFNTSKSMKLWFYKWNSKWRTKWPPKSRILYILEISKAIIIIVLSKCMLFLEEYFAPVLINISRMQQEEFKMADKMAAQMQ